MKIQELNIIEFGCLKDKKITLGDGLNLILGENESGKSTVMLFIRFMFYGLPARSKKNYDRERSLSFEGHRAAGTMILEKDGRCYLVERQAVALGTKLSEKVKVTELDSGEVLEGDVASRFLGVPVEVFESSCFVSQMRATEVNGEKTASAVENMLVSADESVDVTRVLDRMDKVRKVYKLARGNGGVIYDTVEEIKRLNQRQRDLTDRYVECNEQGAELERKRTALAAAKNDLTASENALEQVTLGQILREFSELDGKKARLQELDRRKEELKAGARRKEKLPDDGYRMSLSSAISSLEDAVRRYESCDEKYNKESNSESFDEGLAALGERVETRGGAQSIVAEIKGWRKSAEKKKGWAFALIGLSVAVGACIAIPFGVAFLPWVLAAAAAVLLGGGVALFALSEKAKKAEKQALSEFSVDFDKIEEYLEGCENALAIKRETEARRKENAILLSASRNTLEDAESSLREVLGTALELEEALGGEKLMSLALSEGQRVTAFLCDLAELDREIAILSSVVSENEIKLSGYDRDELRSKVQIDVSRLTDKDLKDAKQRNDFNKQRVDILVRQVGQLEINLAGIRGGLQGDPVEIADRISELSEKLARDREYYMALTMAMEYIDKASTNMSGSITPIISKRAGELLSELSGGKHPRLQTTKTFGLSVEQDGFTFDGGQLSGGTKDAAYLCLRIALLLNVFGEECPPVMLDEALCQMDDGRAATLLRMLGRLSGSGLQCILFTCHSREAQLCRDEKIEATTFEL